MKTFAIVLALILVAGCATTSTTQPTQTVPAGCEQALIYKVPGFMPNGPMLTRVAIATALGVASAAGHPEFKLLVSVVAPMLYKATLTNTLSTVLPDVQAKFKTPAVINYATPLLALFDSLTQAGFLKTGVTDCDRNVIGSLFKNIAIDAGADPAPLQ